MKKIGFYGDSLLLQNAGISHYNTMLLEWFQQEFSDANLECIVPFESSKIKAKTKLIKLKKWPLHQRLRSLIHIPNYVNRQGFDLVIEPAHFGPLRINRRTKRLTVIHDLSPIHYPQFHPWLSVKMHQWFIRKILRQTDLIIVNSTTTKNELVHFDHELKEKIYPLYPEIASFPFSEGSETKPILGPYLLAVGTIEPRKNYSFLVEVFEQFVKENDDYSLVILGGDGWKNKAFYQQLENIGSNKIILTGYVSTEEKNTWYKHADAYLSTSHYEGFGMPVIEAMAYKLPLFLSNIEAYKEIAGGCATLLDFEKNAWLTSLQKQWVDPDKNQSTEALKALKAARINQSIALKKRIINLLRTKTQNN